MQSYQVYYACLAIAHFQLHPSTFLFGTISTNPFILAPNLMTQTGIAAALKYANCATANQIRPIICKGRVIERNFRRGLDILVNATRS